MPAAPDRRRWRSEAWLVMSAPQSSHCCNYESSEQIISRLLRCDLRIREIPHFATRRTKDVRRKKPGRYVRNDGRRVGRRFMSELKLRPPKEAGAKALFGCGCVSRRLKAPLPRLKVGGFHQGKRQFVGGIPPSGLWTRSLRAVAAGVLVYNPAEFSLWPHRRKHSRLPGPSGWPRTLAQTTRPPGTWSADSPRNSSIGNRRRAVGASVSVWSISARPTSAICRRSLPHLRRSIVT